MTNTNTARSRSGLLASVALAAGLTLAACAVVVTPEQRDHLRDALTDERLAVAPITSSSESAVALDRAAIDHDLAGDSSSLALVTHLTETVKHERTLVAPRPGFEAAVARLRATEDRDLAAWKEAAR
jgi:hypothetical protein